MADNDKDTEDDGGSLRDAIEAAMNPTEDTDGDGGSASEPAKADAAQDDTTPADGAQGDDTAAAEPQNPDASEAVIPAPPGWSDEAMGQFRALAPDTQRYVAEWANKHVNDHSQKQQELANHEQRLQALDGVITDQVRQRWQASGLTESQAIGQLLAAQQMLDQNPTQALAMLARQYGVNLGHQPNPQLNGRANVAPQANPQVAQLGQQVNQLQQQLQSTIQSQTQQNREQLERTITRWAGETGSDGQPLRPHFNRLQKVMMPIVQHVMATEPTLTHAEILDRAYDQAAYADPETRKSLVEAQFAQREAEAKAKRLKEAERAKAASASVSGDTDGAAETGSTRNKSVRESIMDAKALSAA